MKKLKQKVSLTLDPDVIEQIRVFAYREDLSFSGAVNAILQASMTGSASPGKPPFSSGNRNGPGQTFP